MKRLILVLVAIIALASHSAIAQELYQYAKDSVMQTNAGKIHIIRANDAYIHFAKAEPVYERFEPATSSNPAIIRNDEGFWEIDYSRFSKPTKTTVSSAIKSCLNQYLSILKTSTNDNHQVWITIRTDSQGTFKNADVKIWAEPSIYRQIPPEVLCGLLNALDDLQFGIPPEYQCISDHYFRYSVFFRDL